MRVRSRRPFQAAGLALVVLLAACASAAPPVTSTAPDTVPSTRVTVPPSTSLPPEAATDPSVTTPKPLDLDLVACDEAPVQWEVFCDVHELIHREYVDPVDDVQLAAAAARGIAELAAGPETSDFGPLTCVLPSDSFSTFCDALALEQAIDGMPLAERIEAGIQGMIVFGLRDGFSSYLTPAAVEKLREDESGEVEGIGAFVVTESRDSPEQRCAILSEACRLVIVNTIADSPAEAAGLQSGDAIVVVDGESVDGWTVDEVVAAVRGPAGTEVTLGISRQGSLLSFTLSRAAITVPVVTQELLEPGLGYLRVNAFAESSPSQVHDALQDLLSAGAEEIILDLQDNPGGALDAAVRIASEFLSDGLVLRTESPQGSTSYEVRSGGLATSPEIALVVLVNGLSASASEVLASALQETGRATIIGEPTFGKNSVQRRFPLSSGGAVRLSIARWVTPEGVDYGQTGIQPDVLVELGRGAGHDVLIEAARDWLDSI